MASQEGAEFGSSRPVLKSAAAGGGGEEGSGGGGAGQTRARVAPQLR
jgi:hypothetical protein